MLLRQGFSLVEIAVTVAILTLLSAVGIVLYMNYLADTRRLTLESAAYDIEENVQLEVNLMLVGLKSSTPSADSGEVMTKETTCDEYVRSLAARYSHIRNPYDGSPLITLWPGWRTQQKRGKVRITCYKVHKGYTVSGSHCPISEAGIRVDTYFVDCGGACETSHCQIADKDCSSLNEDNPAGFEQRETDRLYGKVLPVRSDGGLDWAGMTADCGQSPNWAVIHPKEPDY
ncbi:MAG: type IV pilin protein [Candidatus Puniceispirillaceae bacterium]